MIGKHNLTIKKYLNPLSYLRVGMNAVNEKVLDKYDIYSAPEFNCPLAHPPVFIIGAPRSGSTLLFQALTDAFDVGYLTNRHNMYFGSPRLCEILFQPLKNKSASNFSSNHGQTEGWDAPSECGAWWYRFFPREPAYVTEGDVSVNEMRRFRRSLAGYVEVAHRPVIFKNLYASLRLELIAKYIPEALFVWIIRDEVANAQSILEAKYKDLGSYEPWWSVPLPDMECTETLSPACKAMLQVQGINALIKDTINKEIIPKKSVMIVNYEEFCQNTEKTLKDFESMFKLNRNRLETRFSIPSMFEMKNEVRIPQRMYEELIANAREKEHGQ